MAQFLVAAVLCLHHSPCREGFAANVAAGDFFAVIACRDMTTEDRIEICIGAAFGVLLTVATPQLPRDAKIICWILYLAGAYGFLVFKCRHRWNFRMSLPFVLVVGWVFITVASVTAYYVFPAEVKVAVADDDPLVPGNGPMPELPRGPSKDKMLKDFEEMISDVPEDQRNKMLEGRRKSLEDMPEPPPPEIPESAVRIYFGGTVTWTERFPYTALAQSDEDMVVVEKLRDGKDIVVSAKLFDSTGQIMCTIDQNQIYPNRNNVFRIKRPNASRLIVIDFQERPVIDIEYINPKAIRFLGDFYLRHGRHIILREDFQQWSPFMSVSGMVYPPLQKDAAVGLWITPPPGTTRPYAIGVEVTALPQ